MGLLQRPLFRTLTICLGGVKKAAFSCINIKIQYNPTSDFSDSAENSYEMAGLGRTHLVLREEDVVKLVCEFLENRAMTISQVSLERESGVINGDLSDDLIFLRQLILDGQWEDCLEFIQPLASLQTFDFNLFNFLILKHKFVELLCIKNEIPLGNTDSAVEEVVKVLKEIEV